MDIFWALYIEIYWINIFSIQLLQWYPWSLLQVNLGIQHLKQNLALWLQYYTFSPLHDSHLAWFSVWTGCMSIYSVKTLGCFWNIPIFLSVFNPKNMGPLACTMWKAGFMNKFSHLQLMALTPYCLIVLPPFAFRVVLSWLYPAKEFPDTSNSEGFTFM